MQPPRSVIAEQAYRLPRPRPAIEPARARLAISVASGTGSAPTMLAAFDAALRDAGVADYNLIRLSSVIPAGSVITPAPGPLRPSGSWGDRLYVVLADARTDTPGTGAWAGLGWARDVDSGRGLLVEHEGHAEADVVADVEASLSSLRRGRGSVGERLTDQQTVVAGINCTGEPVCAVVVAVFAAEPWLPIAAESSFR